MQSTIDPYYQDNSQTQLSDASNKTNPVMAHDQQIASHIVRRSSRRNVTQVKYKFDQDDEALEAMTVDEGGDTLMEDAQQSVSSPKKANGRTKKALVKPISMANKVTKRVSAKAPKKVNEDIQAKVTHDSAIATKRGRGSKQQVITSEDLVPDESDLLEPVGTPEVYADNRQPLCEALPYYRAYQSGAYTSGGYFHSILLAKDISGDKLSHLDGEVVIARAGGGCGEDESGQKTQTKDQNKGSTQVQSFTKSKESRHAIVVLIAKKNTACKIRFPHAYNVLGYFQAVETWAEMSNGKIVQKYRLEKINLAEQSWWEPKGTKPPQGTPNFDVHATSRTCKVCGVMTKKRYEQTWLCLNQDCAQFFKDAMARDPPTDLTYSKAFLQERTEWPTHIKPAYSLKPALPAPEQNGDADYSYSAWQGMCCEKCGLCSSRILWDRWTCQGCGFFKQVSQRLLTASNVQEPGYAETTGHAISRDIYSGIPMETIYHGNWRISKYSLVDDNVILHFHANKTINDAPGGSNDLFLDLQRNAGKIGLARSLMTQSHGGQERYTRHFVRNFGMPYNYVAATASTPFSEAPMSILMAVERMNWARRFTVADGTSPEANELLAAGYFEKAKMGYHDDGEETLGPLVASLSLGGVSQFRFRLKSKYYTGKNKQGKPDNQIRILPRSANEQERRALPKALENAGSEAEKNILIKEAYKGMKSFAPVLLDMHLEHGDMVVMHGAEIQKYYEHEATPGGQLRFALTTRYVKPDKIPASEHWRSDYDSSKIARYNGEEFEGETLTGRENHLVNPLVAAQTSATAATPFSAAA